MERISNARCRRVIRLTGLVFLGLMLGRKLCADRTTNSTVAPNAIGLEMSVAKVNSDQMVQEDQNKIISSLQKRHAELLKIFNSKPTDWEAYEREVRAEIKDFPVLSQREIFGNPYGDMMTLMWHYEHRNPDKTRKLAEEVAASAAPEHYRLLAKGYLRRMYAMGKPLAIRFTSVDGREADSSKMRGKVVLIDFWATTCPGCIEQLPELKAAYKKFHPQGFEVIGISCDPDTNILKRFLKRKEIPWPQYGEALPLGGENKLAREFGIYGIPHMMLLDKKSCLREDNVKVTSDFEAKIAKLLAE